MKPRLLRLRNFRTYPELDLEFGTGLIGILGEIRDAPAGSNSNGSGKSSILEALDIALFGRRSLAGYLTRGGDVDELMVELTFDHAGEMYRVRRTFSAKGRGKTSVDLERSDSVAVDGSWEPLTRASAKETDEYLCDLIGLSKTTFRDSSYLRQGDEGFADPNRDPRQRKQLLVEAVLGRNPIWPRLAELAKARRKTAETQLERFAGESEALLGQAASRDAVAAEVAVHAAALASADMALAGAEKQHADVVEAWTRSREALSARQAAAAEVEAASVTVSHLELRLVAATSAEKEIAATRDRIVTLATPDQLLALEAEEETLREKIAAHVVAFTDYDRSKRGAVTAIAQHADYIDRAAKERAAALLAQSQAAAACTGEATCDRCGQTITNAAAAHAFHSFEAEAERLNILADSLDEEAAKVIVPDLPAEPPAAPEGDPAELRRRVTVARTQQQERARYQERISQLQQAVETRPTDDEVAAARASVTAKQEILAGLAETVRPTIEEAESLAAVTLKRRQREDTLAAKTKAEIRLDTIKAAQERLTQIGAETGSLHTQIDRDLLLEKAYGRDGIPALIIENTAIPSIEAEASRILQALGTSMDVQLRTQAETKTGALRDTLEVVVIKDGHECEYETGLSEGEKTRVAIALRIGLARLLRHRAGGSEMLALDEPSYLDAAGMEALLDVLREIETSGEFSLVFLVSHVAELRDSLEQTITVIQENGVSRIAGAPVLDAVAA